MGWDVTLTEDGPFFFEGNCSPACTSDDAALDWDAKVLS